MEAQVALVKVLLFFVDDEVGVDLADVDASEAPLAGVSEKIEVVD